jgi:hypothetical protein
MGIDYIIQTLFELSRMNESEACEKCENLAWELQGMMEDMTSEEDDDE